MRFSKRRSITGSAYTRLTTLQKSSEIRYWGTNSLFTNFQLIWSKFLYVIGEYSLFANPLFANFLHMIKRAFQVDLRDRPLFANIRYSRIRYSRTSLYDHYIIFLHNYKVQMNAKKNNS